ncbi:MAG TPA: RMD1 family protein [Clostridiales bacterium]|nr:RMD1 family protein [Clostridiales bacterium]
MQRFMFKTCAITNEIDLNKIAEKCNIRKKYTWEEPLVLKDNILSTILNKKVYDGQAIMLFSFGSIVFINLPSSCINVFLSYLKEYKPEIDIENWERYSDDYELRAGNVDEIEMTDEYAIVPHIEIAYTELVSVVLAKSVALEKVEEQLEKILDRIESMIDRLEKGNLRFSDKELAKATARIIRHEYNSISYIMILDRPDVTWLNSNAAEFYDKMSEFFELNDRFEILKSKTDILGNVIDGFSSISHSMRSLFIEWVVIVLIVLEVILMIIELIRS